MSLKIGDFPAVGWAGIGTIWGIGAGSRSREQIEDIGKLIPFGTGAAIAQSARSALSNYTKIQSDLYPDNFSYCSLPSGIANS